MYKLCISIKKEKKKTPYSLEEPDISTKTREEPREPNTSK